MPAEECNNGLWKWGETGECKYETQEEAEEDNEDYYENNEGKNKEIEVEVEEKSTEMQLDKRHIISVTEDDDTYTIVYEKDRDKDKEEEVEEIEEDEIEEDKDISFYDTERNKPFQKEVKDIWTSNITLEQPKNIWDKKFNDITMEKRIFNIETTIEKRNVNGNEKNIVVGYGSIYNSRSENLGGFYEYIAEGAFSPELIENSDVRALINHNQDLILARSQNGKGTLNLKADEKGLRYEFEMPLTSYGNDLLINMENKNLTQSSFAFTIPPGGDEWSTDEEGNDIRTINKIDNLFDISVVAYPAYKQSEADVVVAQRGLAMYKEKEENKKQEKDLVKRSLLNLKIELKKRK